MKPLILVAPLLLGACAGSWPKESYVHLGADADATTLAPSISDCIAEIVPPMAAITIQPPSTAIDEVLTDDLRRKGMSQKPDGISVSYVAAPIGEGSFIRVIAPSAHSSCSQYFSRASGSLHPAGPIMVMKR